LIKGEVNTSTEVSLVERTSRLLMLVKPPISKPASAANRMQAFKEKLVSIAKCLRQTLTYGQVSEMVLHMQLTENSVMAVYFCDPHSSKQRGSNENINGLLRHYLPKGANLSGYSQEQMDEIADEINNRPRKGLGVRSHLSI
jgi:IS30 family transposase